MALALTVSAFQSRHLTMDTVTPVKKFKTGFSEYMSSPIAPESEAQENGKKEEAKHANENSKETVEGETKKETKKTVAGKKRKLDDAKETENSEDSNNEFHGFSEETVENATDKGTCASFYC